MDNHKKWGPVINQSFVDGIPMVDVLEAVWQQSTLEAIKEIFDYMVYSIENDLKLAPESKLNVIKMLYEIVEKMRKDVKDGQIQNMDG